jgi:hypothetical protein
MPSVSITWHTQHDDRVCPICNAIDNYTWTFEGVVPNSLIHPVYGEIWNVVTGSLAHENKALGKTIMFSQCRCGIEPHFDLKDLLESVKKLRDSLKAEMETGTATIKAEEV